MRQLILLAGLVLVACGTSPGPVRRDAGPPSSSPDGGGAAPSPSPAFAGIGDRYASNLGGFLIPKHHSWSPRQHPKGQPAHPLKATLPDPRVVDCGKPERSHNKAELMSCLADLRGRIEWPKDAGAPKPHVLGATVRPEYPDPVWNVSFFINSSTGNNDNTGTDSAHPLKTRSEEVSRWQTMCPMRTANVVDTVQADMPVTDPFVVCDYQETGGGYLVQGTPTTVATISLSGVVQVNRGSGGNGLEANLGASAGSYVGLLLHNTTHDSTAMVHSIVTGTVALIEQPMTPGSEFSSIPGTPVTWSNGDSVTVLRMPKIAAPSSFPITGDSLTNGVSFLNVWIFDNSGAGRNQMTARQTAFVDSRIDVQVVSDQSLFSDVHFGGTGSAQVLAADGDANGGSVFDGGGFASGVGLISEGHDTDIGNDIIFGGGILDEGELAYGDAFFLGGTITALDQAILISSDESDSSYGAGHLYGTVTIDPQQLSGVVYSGALGALTSFPNATLDQDGISTAFAWDDTVTPAQPYGNRSLTPVLLDTDVHSGGYSGIAYSRSKFPRYASGAALRTMPSPVPYLNAGANVAINANTPGPGQVSIAVTGAPPTGAAGGDLSGTYPNPNVSGLETKALPSLPVTDQYLHYNGTAWVFSPLVTGVSSVTGSGAGINVSPTTGAAVISNTGVTSVSCSGSVSCSPSTGAVSFTGSGVTGSGTAHDVAVWSSSSAIGAVGGSTNGQPLLWISGSADPSFLPLDLSGSGRTGTLDHGHGGTDVTSCGSNGNVLTCSSGNWTASASALPLAAFVPGGTTVALGAGITTIASASLTVPSGRNIAISISWQFENSNPGSDFNGMLYGYGLASGSYVRTGTVSIPMHNGSRLDGVFDGFASGSMQAQATSSGSAITVFAEVTGNPDTAIGVNAQITLIETN